MGSEDLPKDETGQARKQAPMKLWRKAAIGFAVFLVLLASFIGLILPGIVRDQAIAKVRETTGRTLAIGNISINPFTWTVQVDKVRLTEKGSDVAFISFSSARSGFSPKSIIRRAPVITELTLTSPYFHIVRTGANSFNFSDLMENKKDEQKPAGEPARFSLNNISIRNGSIDFLDQGLARETAHSVRGLELDIPFISNIPYLADHYITPRLASVVNGAPFRLDGKLKPFAKSAEYSLTLNLNDLDIPFYSAYLPGAIPVAISSGTLSANLTFLHRAVASGAPELEASGKVALAGIAVKERSGTPLFNLTRASAEIGKAELLAGRYAIPSVAVEGPELFVSRAADGKLNLSRLSGEPKSAKNPAATKEATPKAKGKENAKKTLVNIAATTLAGGKIHFSDKVPPGGFSTDLNEIAFAMSGFSTEPEKKGDFTLSFLTGRKEKGGVKGSIVVEPLLASASLTMNDLVLESFYPYLAGAITAPVKGRIDIATELAYGVTGLKLDKTEVKLRQLDTRFGASDGLKVAQVSLTGGSFDLAKSELEIGEVSIKDGSLKFSRDEQGALSPLALLKSTGKQEQGKPAPSAGAKTNNKPFTYRVKAVNGSGLNVLFTDGMKEERPEFKLSKTSFSLNNLSGPKQGAIPFKFASGFSGTGSIKASGNVIPSPLSVKGECILARIPLADFEPYLPEGLKITLADGSIDTTIGVDLAKAGENLKGSFKGELGVRSFYLLDDVNNEDLLKWESLQLDKISGTLAPFTLNIAEVALNKFFARLIINKDGTLNLQQLYTPENKPGAAPPEPAAKPAATAAAAAPKQQPAGKTIKIDSVTMQDGTLSFSDRHTKTEYSTTMFNLGGRVSGLSSEENRFADVDLRGNLENHSPLQITGKINPLRDDLFVDLKASFTDIELSPVTPYSGTYLGYAVDRGKLFLDLKYLIQNKKLDSENKVFIDQLTFGQKIDSEKSTNLPVKLAVALLKDRKGEIHLDIPVTGQTNDPEFRVWRVVFQILKNLLVKAATAPFAILGSMLGGAEDFSGVSFQAGSAELAPAETGKLAKLGKMLLDRPGIKLEVAGFVDKEKDAEGYRAELLRKKMKGEKFLALVKEKKNLPGQTPDSIEVLPDERSRYLKAVYLKEKFPKPRNAVGMVKSIPDDEMKKLFLANTVVSEQDLKTLARERVAIVINTLVKESGMGKERLFEKSGDVFKKPAKTDGPASRVEFGVAAD